MLRSCYRLVILCSFIAFIGSFRLCLAGCRRFCKVRPGVFGAGGLVLCNTHWYAAKEGAGRSGWSMREFFKATELSFCSLGCHSWWLGALRLSLLVDTRERREAGGKFSIKKQPLAGCEIKQITSIILLFFSISFAILQRASAPFLFLSFPTPTVCSVRYAPQWHDRGPSCIRSAGASLPLARGRE